METTLLGFRAQTAQYERLRKNYSDIYTNNDYEPWEKSFDQLVKVMDGYHIKRKKAYLSRDDLEQGWFLKKEVIGMTMYVDLFSDNLEGYFEHINYLKNLGVTFIHFMPLLQGRPGENDGGYAVMAYKKVDTRFGDFKIFERLLTALHKEGMYGCVDFVVNHTAKEHEWAQKAMSGDEKFMDMYYMYEDDTFPKAYEKTMPEVFPKVAPGNFNYYEAINRYVMTSFYEFQWDLNYNNPLVFEKIVDILLYLANKGIDMIRMDAIPFIWKELGTTCRNLPEIHLFLEMFHIIVAYVAPSVVLLGEAIVEAEEIVGYYGKEVIECDVMYNAPMMVNIWNGLATRDTTLLKVDMNKLQIPRSRAWINYARCHDDIGWGFNEDAIRAMGLDPFDHKQFLINFYAGNFEGSFSRGELYEFDTKTMDARNCGTMASLCGLENALVRKDNYQKELALKRMHLINGLIMSMTGIPLIYSGDELATLNNHDFKMDEKKSHDTRWLHRSKFDWSVVEHLDNHELSSTQVFNQLKRMIEVRKSNSIFDGDIRTYSLELNKKEVLGTMKRDEDGFLIGVYNFSEDRQFISVQALREASDSTVLKDLLQGKSIDLTKESLVLGPYEYLWLVNH